MSKPKRNVRPKIENTRKAMRKQKRQQKKINRREHYSKKENGRFAKRPASPELETKKNISTTKSMPVQKQKQQKKKSFGTSLDLVHEERLKELKTIEKMKSEMGKKQKEELLRANEEEDKVIHQLEKRLGLNKSKNKNKSFASDGLDYLLEICDGSTKEQIVAAEKHLVEVEGDSDFDEDLTAVTDKHKLKEEKNKLNDVLDDLSDEDASEELSEDFNDENVSEESDSNDDLSGDSDGTPEEYPSKQIEQKKKHEPQAPPRKKMRVVSEEDVKKVFSDDEVSHLSSDNDDDGDDGDETLNDEVEEKKEKPDVWEDIYGRKRDKEGNIIKEEKGVYIPPHLRNKDSSSDEQFMLLKRQIKSILNKLAGTNLHWASSSLESLYSSNSRHSVNSALTESWLDACVGASSTPDRMVAEHAALVSVLHANVGSEIGAHFLQELSKRFNEMMQSPQPVENKTLDNLVSCLAYLYSFKMYHASLLYDILTRLLEELSEKNISCVLVALRSAGGVLRKEEPLALKDFIRDTQEKLTQLNHTSTDGSRIKFLLEVLMALKNNNLRKIPNYDPSYAEELKKMARGIVRRGNYVTSLNIRLEDLLKADERGKWWVVGAAWERGAQAQREPPAAERELLALAARQRMNTDVRRSVFCAVMSAENYLDAFEKLQHLGLKGRQQREIVHVLLSCALQERTYNPYYALLAQRLCDFDRKFQLSFQFSVWDKLKELDKMSKQHLSNLAQLLTHLFMKKGLPLSVLKIINFSELNKRSLRFMRQILLAIIMHEDLQTTLEVFYRVAKGPKLHMFRESIRLFIQHFLKRSNVVQNEEMDTLKTRASEVEKVLMSQESKLRF